MVRCSILAGWLRSYRITLEDASAASLPREVIHHIGVADFERRELVYPMVGRIFAVGKETPPVTLPAAFGVPVALGEHFGLYEGFQNETGRDIPAAYVHLTILWTPTGIRKPLSVLPFYAEVNNDIGGHSWYDVPPGRSTRRAEFELPVGGGLIAVGGHRHDYARAVRLEDAETGKVLVRFNATCDKAGHIVRLGTFRFGYHTESLYLAAHHRYRIVAEYDNPTAETIPKGAMASMAGPFVPHDMHALPQLDLDVPDVRRDMASLGAELPAVAAER